MLVGTFPRGDCSFFSNWSLDKLLVPFVYFGFQSDGQPFFLHGERTCVALSIFDNGHLAWADSKSQLDHESF